MPETREEKIVEEVLRDFAQASQNRFNWEEHWEQIAQRVLPDYRNTFRYNNYRTPGEIRTQYQYDSTAALALQRFSAIMTSLLTPDNEIWHRLRASDMDLMKSRNVKLYFEQLNNVLWQQRRRTTTNFSGQNLQSYESLGAFGTTSLFINENRRHGGLRYKQCSLGKSFILENDEGEVDRHIYYDKFKAYQLEEKFGREVLPEAVTTAMEKNKTQDFEVVYWVGPRTDYDPSRFDKYGMKFAAYYVLKKPRVLLAEGGFNTFPYAVGRYIQTSGEVYGRSPAMAVLPAIKTLNEEKKTLLKQGHRTVDPVIFINDDSMIDALNIQPGAINSGGMSDEGKRLFDTLPIGNVAVGKDMMDDERAVINDAFLTTLFQILVDTPRMTATEVLERTREKGILLAPTVGRQQAEYLGSMIPREIDVLTRQRLLPEMPPELREARGEYEIEYDNEITRTARAQEAAGFMQVLETAITVAGQTGSMEPIDHFDFDKIIPAISALRGVPTDWMRDPKVIAARRNERKQAEEIAQAAQAAPGAAALITAGAKAQEAAKG